MATSPHHVGLEVSAGFVHGWVLTLPGCVTGGPTAEAVTSALSLAIPEYLGWLAQQGELMSPDATFEVVEQVQPSEIGDTIFAAELAPLTSAELDLWMRRMDYARAELLAEVAALLPAVLDWQPPERAFDRFDAWAPEVRTIRDVVAHVLSFEHYYAGGLQDGPSSGISKRVDNPEALRGQTRQRLRTPDAVAGRVYQPLRSGLAVPEEWTARKVIRRIISHERAHLAEIQQRRAWAAFGLPS